MAKPIVRCRTRTGIFRCAPCGLRSFEAPSQEPGAASLVRVRFADLRSVTRSLTLPAPISATAILAETAETLVRAVLANHPDEKTISLLAISVSNLEKHSMVQLELSLGLEDEKRRPGTKKGAACFVADRAVDTIRDRFGWEAVGYGLLALGISRSRRVPRTRGKGPLTISSDRLSPPQIVASLLCVIVRNVIK
jgi:hypothetical protein